MLVVNDPDVAGVHIFLVTRHGSQGIHECGVQAGYRKYSQATSVLCFSSWTREAGFRKTRQTGKAVAEVMVGG